MSEPTQAGRYLCYEGFPLESVLARVTAEHGAAAVITSAERVRKGGVKGFFAREVFQVIVEVGQQGDVDAPAVPTRTFVAEAFDSSEIDPEDVEGALALGLSDGRTEPFFGDADLAADTAFGDDAELWALLATAGGPEPVSSTVDHEPEPTVLAAALLDAAPSPPVWASPVRSELPFVAETVRGETIAAELVQPLRSLGPIASTTVIAAQQPSASVFGTPFDPFRRPNVPQSDEVIAHSVAAVGLGAQRAPRCTAVDVAEPVPAWPVAAPWPAISARSRLGSMMDSLDASLPPVPATPERGVIVVVGERVEAIASANALAARLGVGPNAVLVASPSAEATVPSESELAAIAKCASEQSTPRSIVVVELLAGRHGHEWTRAVVGGVAAAQVRFVADASRFVSHQHLSVAAIGGVDVVDLVGMDEVDEPTAALAVGIPIGSLDGRPASTELWAATLLVSRAITVDSDLQLSAGWYGAEGE